MPDQIEQIISLMLEAKRLTHENFLKRDRGFSPLQMFTLHFIASHDQAVMGDIAQIFGITPPSATALIDGMVKLGLVDRLTKPTDRRIVRLVITKKGQSFLKQKFQIIKQRIRRVLGLLTKDEQQTLIRILSKLAGKLKN